MNNLEAIAALFPDLEVVEITSWIEYRWVRPQAEADGGWTFHEIDIARLRFIHEMRRDLGVNDEAIPLVLNLLDQVYGLRDALRTMTRAIERQPPEVRDVLLQAISAAETPSEPESR
jgi:chaperone modulatory protein CbpM